MSGREHVPAGMRSQAPTEAAAIAACKRQGEIEPVVSGNADDRLCSPALDVEDEGPPSSEAPVLTKGNPQNLA